MSRRAPGADDAAERNIRLEQGVDDEQRHRPGASDGYPAIPVGMRIRLAEMERIVENFDRQLERDPMFGLVGDILARVPCPNHVATYMALQRKYQPSRRPSAVDQFLGLPFIVRISRHKPLLRTSIVDLSWPVAKSSTATRGEVDAVGSWVGCAGPRSTKDISLFVCRIGASDRALNRTVNRARDSPQGLAVKSFIITFAGAMLICSPATAQPMRIFCASESRNPSGQMVRDEVAIALDPALEHADVTYLYAPEWIANPQPERYSAVIALSPTRAIFTLTGPGIASGQTLIVDRKTWTLETPGLARRNWSVCRVERTDITRYQL